MPAKSSKKTPKIVLVRTYSAGVHVGELVSRNGQEVVLKDSHRIWRWRGANTLTELAAHGAHMTEHTRISERAPGEVVLTQAIEVIDTSPQAAENLRKPRWL
jgi:hypothetical protein